MNQFGIGMIYRIGFCEVFYGDRDKILDILINCTDGNPYGWFFKTKDRMMNQVDYYKSVKENTTYTIV